jgi:hypothetical protein
VQRSPYFADTYLLDHDDERALLAEIVVLARECQGADTAALERLRRQTVALTEHAESHVRKENELVLPVCREMFSPAEQGEMVSTMLSAFSPEVMARAAGWIVSKVDADTGAAYLGELSAVMPAPVLQTPLSATYRNRVRRVSAGNKVTVSTMPRSRTWAPGTSRRKIRYLSTRTGLPMGCSGPSTTGFASALGDSNSQPSDP